MVLLIDITIAVRAPYLRPNHAIHALKSGTKVQYISDFHTTIMQLFDFLGSFCYHGITNLQIDIP